jgi:CheY-like chemotaxis protein
MPEHNNRNFRILVVEDNPLNQKVVGMMIRNWGMLFDLCGNGRQAIEKIRETKYDLVLMDLQMPEMNGYEATSVIREKLGNNVPVVALTAHESDEEREKCTASGMNAYVTKPINEKILSGVVSGLLQASGIPH